MAIAAKTIGTVRERVRVIRPVADESQLTEAERARAAQQCAMVRSAAETAAGKMGVLSALRRVPGHLINKRKMLETADAIEAALKLMREALAPLPDVEPE